MQMNKLYSEICNGAYRSMHHAIPVINVRSPTGLAMHNNGDIYVLSCHDDSIYVYDNEYQLKRTISECRDAPFSASYFIAIKEETLYVTDYTNHCIYVLTTKGEFLSKIGCAGSGAGELLEPCGIAVDDDRIVVSDYGNQRIQIFDLDGTFVRALDCSRVDQQNRFKPSGLALDSEGNIHVSCWAENTIKVFKPEGSYVRKYGNLSLPTGIVIDKNEFTLVNSHEENKLYIFDSTENLVHQVETSNGPRGVLLDPRDGGVYVATEYSNVIEKYSA